MRELPKTVVIFIVGGLTPAEVKLVNEINKKLHDELVIVGGSSFINSRLFFDDYVLQ